MNLQNIECLGGMVKYLPIIECYPDKIKQTLLDNLTDLKKIGVKEYGRRIIYKDGSSNMITTSNKWIEAFNSEQLKESMIIHMSGEVLQVKRNNFSLITRSSDKITNDYLRVLDYLGLNNSVIKYHFYKDYIEISYFVASKIDSFARDLFLNKMSVIEQLEQKILPVLINLQSSNTFEKEKEKLIHKEVADILFKNNSFNITGIYNYTNIALDHKELSYLAYLGFECSNKYIAKSLSISESTVKLDISNLKVKLKAEDRDELVEFANTTKIKQLIRVMNII